MTQLEHAQTLAALSIGLLYIISILALSNLLAYLSDRFVAWHGAHYHWYSFVWQHQSWIFQQYHGQRRRRVNYDDIVDARNIPAGAVLTSVSYLGWMTEAQFDPQNRAGIQNRPQLQPKKAPVLTLVKS